MKTLLTVLSSLCCLMLAAATLEMGDGFRDHGVASPASQRRGVFAARDGEGRDVVLVWLMDVRGGYAILQIDAETGKSVQVPIPFVNTWDSPYSSILATNNRLYSHFGCHFVEYDPVKREFTACYETIPQMAMSMHEDGKGRIWGATFPQNGLMSFDPVKREFKDYGSINQENWMQYPRTLESDASGKVYLGSGMTYGQIFIFDPATGKAEGVIAPTELVNPSMGRVMRTADGKVYGTTSAKDAPWFELTGGNAVRLDKAPAAKPVRQFTGDQSYIQRQFPSGKVLTEFDVVERTMTVSDPKTKERKQLKFDYTSEGTHVMGIDTAADGTISGGSYFPFRLLSYDPAKDTWTRRDALHQFNTILAHGDHFYVGAYCGGYFYDWRPKENWNGVAMKIDRNVNPAYFGSANPAVNRPHALKITPDGKTLLMGGTPDYGITGAPLAMLDLPSGKITVADPAMFPKDESTHAIAVLSNELLLGGGTIEAGTGGEVKAKDASLYLFDLPKRQVIWQGKPLSGVRTFMDMTVLDDGKVLGVADRTTAFVFDPAAKKLVKSWKIAEGPTVSQQGPRVFVRDGKALYMLLATGVARLDPATGEVIKFVKSPVPLSQGGAIWQNRIYFIGKTHLYSLDLAKLE